MNKLVKSDDKQVTKSNLIQDELLDIESMKIKERPYTAQITSNTPTAFIFLIDQSSSMKGGIAWNESQSTKAEIACIVINKLLEDLVEKTKSGNTNKDYYKVSVIGYGGPNNDAHFAWQNRLAGSKWLSMAELSSNKDVPFKEKRNITSRDGSVTEKIIDCFGWISPVVERMTPMKSALDMTSKLLDDWLSEITDVNCFPPIVFNITDGEANEEPEDLILASDQIRSKYTYDGHVLFFNIHICSKDGNPVIFPTGMEELPDNNITRTLYNMSSIMPQRFVKEIKILRQIDIDSQYVAMAYNANAESFLKFMNIGTSHTR